MTVLLGGTRIRTCDPFRVNAARMGQSPFLRELIIPFGRSGYVALFEIEGASHMLITAVRHQLEDDYY